MNQHPKHQSELVEKQQQLLLEIEKSHKLILQQLYSSLYVVIMFILVFFFFIFFLDGALWQTDIIFFLVNTSIFSLIALNNLRKLWPFWKEINFRIKGIKEKSIVSDSQIICEGVTSYVNQINNRLFSSIIGIKRALEVSSDKFEHESNIRLTRGWIVHLIIGIVIVIVNHLVMVIFFQPRSEALFWLYISYLGIILTYAFMIVHERRTREMFRRWVRVFAELDDWAHYLESLPILHEFNQLNGEL